MSKWLNKEDYEMFANQKANEAEKEPAGGGFYKKWKNPQMGTTERAKEYAIRLLPNIKRGFYKEYLYHAFTSGENFTYFLCEKTGDLDKYCPWCEANKILYQGNESDKKKAADYKRKERYVSNVFIVDDPRDAEMKDDQYKVNGTVRLYEFPATLESKIKTEITDKKNGYGYAIFDPANGYDFLLKIKAKPKDKSGKEWPDYGDCMFARRASAIAEGDAAIDAVMATRVDLDEYINSMRLSVDEHEKLLKQEMLWDDVSRNFEKNFRGVTKAVPAAVDQLEDEDPPFEGGKPISTTKAATAPKVVEKEEDGDDTDALLAELQDM